MTLRPWPLIASKSVFDAGLFQVTRDRARSPRTGGEHDFHVLHMVDWLTVVPLTEDGHVVFVRQYRHGSRQMSLELPGGLRDAADEQAQSGAARELSEETGYGGGEFFWLGDLRPQPALLSNRLRVYGARKLKLRGAPAMDAGEDIEVVLIDAQSVAAYVGRGEIDNAMTIAALAMASHAGLLSCQTSGGAR